MKKYIYLLFILVWGVLSCKSGPKTVSADTEQAATSVAEQPQDPTPEAQNNPPVKEEQPQTQTAQTGTFVLSGTIADASANQPVQILQLPYSSSKTQLMGQGTTTGTGQFKIAMNNPGKGVYSLKLGQQQLIFLLDGAEKSVNLDIPKGGFKSLDVQVKGADQNLRYYKIMKAATTGKLKPDALIKTLKAEKEPLLASLVALQVLKDPSFAEVHRMVQKKLAQDPAVNRKIYTDPYDKYVSSMEMQARKSVIKVGMKAPDLAYKNPEGKIMKLSDLRGKLVLLDFWASWCSPCRRANPEVVQIYKKYKDKGFTVFSVSLDGDRRGSTDPKVTQMHRDRWVKAIRQDGLIWPNHVSDLKSWNSEAAAKYGVTSIPATFLIGRDGKVVAINPRNNLEATVKANL